MNGRRRELELRQRLLVLRSTLLRAEIGGEGRRIQSSLGQVDRGVTAVRTLVASPVVLAVAGIAVVLVGPLRALRWAGRGLVALTLVRRVVKLLG
jgi:hypothetical protein